MCVMVVFCVVLCTCGESESINGFVGLVFGMVWLGFCIVVWILFLSHVDMVDVRLMGGCV